MTDELDECPECGAPEQDLLGHEVRGVYDGILFWTCNACGHAWPRAWEEGSRRYYRARELVDAWNHQGDGPLIPHADPE